MYTIGTKYMTLGKHPNLCTVVDILTTTNLAGETVKTRYVASHVFCGQTVLDHDVGTVTIARGIWKLEGN